ncbi:MAG: hypothetical protein MZV65_33470 [Chromatiales bacterium]|nr:hypothetical protein [Chromatiales bacterium]
MSNHRQRVFGAIAGAFLMATGTAWGDKLDPKAVEQFQTQLNMAMQGSADAQYRVGEMYEQGLGTAKNSSMAFLWFNKASIQGNAKAKEKLVLIDNKSKAETAVEQDRVNAAMRALQQQDQDVTKQKAAEAARNRQADEATKQKAAAEAAARAKAEAAATKTTVPKPAPAAAAAPKPAAAATPVPAAAAAAAPAAASRRQPNRRRRKRRSRNSAPTRARARRPSSCRPVSNGSSQFQVASSRFQFL